MQDTCFSSVTLVPCILLLLDSISLVNSMCTVYVTNSIDLNWTSSDTSGETLNRTQQRLFYNYILCPADEALAENFVAVFLVFSGIQTP